MNTAIRAAFGVGFLAVPAGLAGSWVSAAGDRLESLDEQAAMSDVAQAEAQVAVASASEREYCTADLKRILRRVLQSCGLLQSGEVRGCQPADAKNVATMAGGDFNALFLPLAKRAGIIQFDKDSSELDDGDRGLLDKIFSDQKGASYFFVVARSSPEGAVKHNRELSQHRAEAVMGHLRQTFNDPDLDKEVGLLWLGEEFAQLEEDFCSWKRSGSGEQCEPKDLNRSAFVAWIDCRL